VAACFENDHERYGFVRGGDFYVLTGCWIGWLLKKGCDPQNW